MSDKQQTSWLRRLLTPFQKSTQEAMTEEGEPKVVEALPPTLVEWSGYLLSALLLSSLMGYVLWGAFQEPAPIAFDYQVGSEQLREHGGGWVLPIDIHNQGGEGILDLTITAELLDDEGEVIDEAEISLPLLGPDETASVEVGFDEDPRLHTLNFNVGSYTLP